MRNINSFLRTAKGAMVIMLYTGAALSAMIMADNNDNDKTQIYVKTVENAKSWKVEEETAKKAHIQPDNIRYTQGTKEDTGIVMSNVSLGLLSNSIVYKLYQTALTGSSSQVIQNATQIATNSLANKEEVKEAAREDTVNYKKTKIVQAKNIEKENIDMLKAIQEDKQEAKRLEEANSYKIELSDDEKIILATIVEAEAGGEDITGKMLVANTVINRVNSSSFPDTVKDVVFQKVGGSYQFSPILDGRYWSVIVSDDSNEAVDRVLKGEDYSQGALYFSARSQANPNCMQWFDTHLTWLFKYGGHEFYK